LSKIVIGIHGLGNKPPKELLSQWWKQAMLEGLRKNNYSTYDFNFEIVYWADILHKNPLDPNETIKEHPLFLSDHYVPDREINKTEEKKFRQKALEYLEKYSKRILVNGVLSLNIPSLTELFIHHHLRDLEEYYSQSYTYQGNERELVREVIIDRLIETLQRHKRKKIFMVAHSMGSIIAYEALMSLSSEIKVEILATIGSPLGQDYVINKMQDDKILFKDGKLIVPENVKHGWYNFSDEEDQVAINHNLSEIFKENFLGVKVKDILVYNNYRISDTRNPHKSYGYLRTPKFASVLNSFLTTKRLDLFNWIRKRFL